MIEECVLPFAACNLCTHAHTLTHTVHYAVGSRGSYCSLRLHGGKRKQNKNKAGLDLKVDFLFLAHLKALTVAPGYNNANRYSRLINTDG